MEKTKNKIVSFLCVALVVCSAITFVPATTAATDDFSGNVGDISWSIKKGTLTIKRNSSAKSKIVEMRNWSKTSNPPWAQTVVVNGKKVNRAEEVTKKIVVTDDVNNIGKYAFYGLKKAKTVEIGKRVSKIDTGAFGHCNSLTDFSVLNSNSCFATSSGILFSKDKKTLYAYPANKSGKSYTIPKTVTAVKGYAFNYNQKLETINQAQTGVKSYGTNCFSNSNIKKIEIGKGSSEEICTEIGDKAFYNTPNLKTVVIPPSVTEIGKDIFNPSKGLKTNIYCNSESPINDYLLKKGGYIRTKKEYSYIVTLDPGIGIVDKKTIPIKYGSKYANLPTPTRTGYTFTGWYRNINGKNELVTNSTQMKIAAKHTLKANYKGNSYILKLNPSNGNCLTDSITVTYGEMIVGLPEASKPGYEFIGWFTEPDGGQQIKNNVIYGNENITTLYAHYIKNLTDVKELQISYKSANKVKLSWQGQDNVNGYEVYIKEENGSYTLYETTSKTSLNIKLNAKKSYKFRVRAFSSDGDIVKYGGYSSTVSRTRTYVKKPNVTKKRSGGLVNIKWDKVKGATGYDLYKYKDKKWKKVKIATGTRSIVIRKSSKKKYKLKIRAYTVVLGHKYNGEYKKITV